MTVSRGLFKSKAQGLDWNGHPETKETSRQGYGGSVAIETHYPGGASMTALMVRPCVFDEEPVGSEKWLKNHWAGLEKFKGKFKSEFTAYRVWAWTLHDKPGSRVVSTLVYRKHIREREQFIVAWATGVLIETGRPATLITYPDTEDTTVLRAPLAHDGPGYIETDTSWDELDSMFGSAA